MGERAFSEPATAQDLAVMKQELAAKGLCEEIPLDFLTPGDANALIDMRFPGHAFPSGLADLVHQRTSGNPLFMTNLMDYLAAQGMVRNSGERWELAASLDTVATASPETLRQVIEAHLSRLTPEERDALEAARLPVGVVRVMPRLAPEATVIEPPPLFVSSKFRVPLLTTVEPL